MYRYPLKTNEIIDILFDLPRGITIDDLKRAFILTVLKRNNGNKTKTSEEIGMSLKCLRANIQKYELEGCEIPIYRGKIV